MSAKKRALGRGLDSLLGERRPLADAPSAPTGRQVVEIPVAEITPNPNQPRFRFVDEPISDLANSIREQGILQPLLVRVLGSGYELIAGERRFRAAKTLEMETVPCLVLDVGEEESVEMALVENLQRENLNPMEEARAFQALIEKFELTQEEASKRVGKARATVANSLRLLNLPLDVQEDVLEGRLTAGHGRAILGVPETPKQRQLRNLIISKNLSVRQAEAQARKLATSRKRKPPKPSSVDAQMRSLQEEFSMKLGLPVFIKAVTSQSGKIEIQYHTLDDFEVVSDFFGVETS